MICIKRSSFIGSPLGQSLLITPLLKELASIVHGLTQTRMFDADVQRTLLYLLNAVALLAFSGRRKADLPPTFFGDVIFAASTIADPSGLLPLPYTPVYCLQLLLSPNRYIPPISVIARDGTDLLRTMTLAQLTELLKVGDPYVRVRLLLEIRSRALHTLRPQMKCVSSFSNTEVKLLRGTSLVNSRAYLTRRCLFLYNMEGLSIECVRVEPDAMTLVVEGNQVVLHPFGVRDAEDVVIKFTNSDVMDTFVATMRKGNVETNPVLECELRALSKGRVLAKPPANLVIHPSWNVLNEKELTEMCALLAKKRDVENEQAKRLVAELCLMSKAMRKEANEEEVRQFLLDLEDDHEGIAPMQCVLGGRVTRRMGWCSRVPAPPAPVPAFSFDLRD